MVECPKGGSANAQNNQSFRFPQNQAPDRPLAGCPISLLRRDPSDQLLPQPAAVLRGYVCRYAVCRRSPPGCQHFSPGMGIWKSVLRSGHPGTCRADARFYRRSLHGHGPCRHLHGAWRDPFILVDAPSHCPTALAAAGGSGPVHDAGPLVRRCRVYRQRLAALLYHVRLLCLLCDLRFSGLWLLSAAEPLPVPPDFT